MIKPYNVFSRTYQGITNVALNIFDWSGPKILNGPGCVKKLAGLVKSDGLTNVLVVTDKVLMGLHLLDNMLAGLEENGIKYAIFDGVQPNPTIDNIEAAYAMYKANSCQGVIALGGGSVMDCAKVAAARVVRPDLTVTQMKGLLKVRRRLPPLYAIPTTAGTGSETTVAAVVTDAVTHDKYPVNDLCLRPKVAVLDPELTIGLPGGVTSTTGMDALTHAVEAYIGRSNTKATEHAALVATRLIFDNLETAYNDGKNIVARQNMLEASYLAGVAFTRAFVGYVHAIAHSMGGKYGTPHGLANAIILPRVLEFYGESVYDRLAELADTAGLKTFGKSNKEKAQMFISEIYRMNKAMGIPDKLKDLKAEDIDSIAAHSMAEANPTYPVPRMMTHQECVLLIRTFLVD